MESGPHPLSVLCGLHGYVSIGSVARTSEPDSSLPYQWHESCTLPSCPNLLGGVMDLSQWLGSLCARARGRRDLVLLVFAAVVFALVAASLS